MNLPVVSVRNADLYLKSGERSLHILRNITFELQAGEVVSVVGPSGSGKTSLLMLLAGLERASSGEISIAGSALGGLSEDQLADVRRRQVGILFQNFHLIPSMTALENVSLALEIAEPGFQDIDHHGIPGQSTGGISGVTRERNHQAG